MALLIKMFPVRHVLNAAGNVAVSNTTVAPACKCLLALAAATRVRSNVHSEPPPDRDRRRRRAFELMDADEEFVNSDLAMRSTMFNQVGA